MATMVLPAVTQGRRRSPLWDYLGVVPFFLYATLFLLLPTAFLLFNAFLDADGHPSFASIAGLFTPSILSSYWVSCKISVTSAVLGAVIGLVLAQAAVGGHLPRWVRPALLTFSGVASNFAGVPLAFAFLATLGRLGLVTVFLRDWFDINLYGLGFNLLSFWGLTLTYLYFQIPLMVLIIVPALEGLKKEWREAAATLGAGDLHYWRMIGFPVLWPSVLGATLLLFANAFGAIATAYALTGPQLNIITIQLYSQIRGDVLHNQNLGAAMALGMVVITGVSNALYIWLRHRSEKWLRT